MGNGTFSLKSLICSNIEGKKNISHLPLEADIQSLARGIYKMFEG